MEKINHTLKEKRVQIIQLIGIMVTKKLIKTLLKQDKNLIMVLQIQKV